MIILFHVLSQDYFYLKFYLFILFIYFFFFLTKVTFFFFFNIYIY